MTRRHTRPSISAATGAPRVAGLLAAACVALLGVACKDDGGDAPSAPSQQGTFTNAAPSPALAAPGIVVGPPPCELALDAFAVVQYRREAMILPGIDGGGGGPIPGTIDDDDLFQVDHVIDDEGLGTVTSIEGTLDASSDGRLEGSLTMEISPLDEPTRFDCGPTVIAVDASRGAKSLPPPNAGLDGADGDWLLTVREIDTSCEPVLEPEEDLALGVVTDLADASAVVTVDDGIEEISFDAVLTDDFLVAKWRLDDEDAIERNLTALRYQEIVVIPQDLMFGVNSVDVEEGGESCVARDELVATRPQS